MDHVIRIRPQRKRLRWRSHTYSADAAYFVTICTLDRQCVFGDIANGIARRTAVGDVVDACWRAIPDHFPEVILDAWVTMPNHLHGILAMGDGLRACSGPGHAKGRSE
jgi:putative transposase